MTMAKTGLIAKVLTSGAIVACASLMLSFPAAADGKKLFGQKLCITCHGPEGKAPIQSTYPKLAGQNKDYLVRQVTDIQSGANLCKSLGEQD